MVWLPPFAQLVFSPSMPLISFRDPASRNELGARPLRICHSELRERLRVTRGSLRRLYSGRGWSSKEKQRRC
jgi:hypothetical protein